MKSENELIQLYVETIKYRTNNESKMTEENKTYYESRIDTLEEILME